MNKYYIITLFRDDKYITRVTELDLTTFLFIEYEMGQESAIIYTQEISKEEFEKFNERKRKIDEYSLNKLD
jgi:hypothetical protein